MQLAVALYNNNVDDEDELEFCKGDILTVLIENPNGFDGWWLCKHKDKCGLCPGNRLKLIQNAGSSPIKSNDFVYSRLSTASMYDGLSNNYENLMIASSSSSNHDYDNSQESDFISNLKPMNSSPDSSSCSSGIYSTNDVHFSSSSSELHTTSTNNNNKTSSSIDLDQLEKSFQNLSIRSLLIDKYRQLISKINIEPIIHSFITECHLFLHNYGYFLDRYTYRLIKENFLYELEYKNKQIIIQLSTKIIQLIDLRLKEKTPQHSLISNDVVKKLHLEPIEEIPKEKMSTSRSFTQIYGKSHRTQMKTSKTCHSNLYNKSNNSDYIDEDDYSINPLIKCYYRHINEQVDLIIKRYSHLLKNENQISLLVIEGKGLVVAGHKLIFVLETLHEHLQQIQTSLMHLTRQLCEALTSLIQLLKQLSQQNCTNIQKLIIDFKLDIKMIMNLVKKIKQYCRLV